MAASITTPKEDSDHQEVLTRELAARNADLTQLNHLKDEFLACVTHELRSPLTAILGLSTLLKDQSLGELNPQQLRYAQLIHRSGRHLISIVNDMLDLTQIETEQLNLNFNVVNISNVCLNAFEQAQRIHLSRTGLVPDRPPIPPPATPKSSPRQSSLRQSRRKATALPAPPKETNAPTFHLEIESGLASLVADENRLKQMLVNLLSNAMKFTENSGNIGLKVLHWEGWVAFTVWDTGIGIPPNKQHLIFQKFQQLESTMTRQFEGTGLGLVLTQRLARLHGGDITFTSQEHHGSQFTLLLPPEPPQTVTRDRHPSTAPQWEIPPPPVSLSSRLVLLIDANTNNLEELTEHLTTLGYRMAIARSGTDALTKARQLQPCAIFLNPNIPLLSGWDVLTLLKSGSETQHIPVIMMGSLGVQAKTRQSEVDGFLSFPIIHRRFKDLLEATSQTIDPIAPRPTQHHVVLYLSDAELPLTEDDSHIGEATQTAIMQLSHLLHRHNFRVIESHDLDQAELLAKVWKAEVVVLNINQVDPMDYLMALIAHPYLASLPLVTLDSHTSHIANQIPNLAVFPCLVDWQQTGPNAVAEVLTETMLQAIEVAVGFAGRPLVLATDVNQWLSAISLDRQDWLQALVRYMQAAGLRTSLGQSQREISQILQSQTVNLLLLYWQGSGTQLQQVLKSLQTLITTAANARFPSIILIDHHPRGRAISPASRKLLDQMNITVVAPDASMDDLLRQIRQVLGVNPAGMDSS